MLVLKIAGAIAALIFGVYLGLASGTGPTVDDVEERMGKNLPRQKATRHFTFMGFLQKKAERGSSRRRRASARRPFDLSKSPSRTAPPPTRRSD